MMVVDKCVISLLLVALTSAEMMEVMDYELGDQIKSKMKEINDGDMMPNEMGKYYGGDILNPPDMGPDEEMPMKNRWKGGVVPFVLSPKINNDICENISRAFIEYESKTCVRFVPRTDEKYFLNITNENAGCFSRSIGKSITGPNEVNLQDYACSTVYTIIHEFMHVLGFWHEQSRHDRDKYIEIRYQNILPGSVDQFQIERRSRHTTYDVPYDINSVTHYSATAFSKNSHATIVFKNNNVMSKQDPVLRDSDVKRIKLMYKCPPTNTLPKLRDLKCPPRNKHPEIKYPEPHRLGNGSQYVSPGLTERIRHQSALILSREYPYRRQTNDRSGPGGRGRGGSRGPADRRYGSYNGVHDKARRYGSYHGVHDKARRYGSYNGVHDKARRYGSYNGVHDKARRYGSSHGSPGSQESNPHRSKRVRRFGAAKGRKNATRIYN